MSTRDSDRFETLAIHAGQQPDPTTGAVMTPVYFTSTYAQSGPGEHKGFEYSRTRNPTRDALQGRLAALDSRKHAPPLARRPAAADPPPPPLPPAGPRRPRPDLHPPRRPRAAPPLTPPR